MSDNAQDASSAVSSRTPCEAFPVMSTGAIDGQHVSCYDTIVAYHGVIRRRSVGSRTSRVFSGSWQRKRTASKVKILVDGVVGTS